MINKLFPVKEKIIETSLNKNEVLERLKDCTFPYSKDKRYYKGKINDLFFTLYQEFDYRPNYMLRPEIRGEIISKNEKTIIKLIFGISSSLRSLFNFAIYLNLTIFIVLIFFISFSKNKFEAIHQFMDLPLGFTWMHLWIIPAAYIFMGYLSYISFKFFLNFKIDNAMRMFRKILS